MRHDGGQTLANPARIPAAVDLGRVEINGRWYHMLKDGTVYEDLGANHFDRRAKGVANKRLMAKLESLEYDVQITPVPA